MIPDKFKYVNFTLHGWTYDYPYDGYHSYYFDENGILCMAHSGKFKLTDEKAGKQDGKLYLLKRQYIESDLVALFGFEYTDTSLRRAMRLISQFCNYRHLGCSYDDFLEFINECKLYKKSLIERRQERENYRGLDRFITRIDPPQFEREIGNQNPNTFDFVRIDLFVVKDWPNKKEYLEKNIKEIKMMAVRKIKNSKRFQNFGVPINFLRLTSLTLTKDDRLEFIFELKELKTKS